MSWMSRRHRTIRGHKWFEAAINDTSRTTEGTVRADIRISPQTPPDLTQSIPRFPLGGGSGAGRAAELRELAHCTQCHSAEQQHIRGASFSGTAFSPASQTRVLLSNSACALLPGQRAQRRSLHPGAELSFSMSCLPGTRNLVAQAGTAHAAMLLTGFQLTWKSCFTCGAILQPNSLAIPGSKPCPTVPVKASRASFK